MDKISLKKLRAILSISYSVAMKNNDETAFATHQHFFNVEQRLWLLLEMDMFFPGEHMVF